MKITDEQRTIMQLLTQGKKNIIIAREMYLSLRSLERRLEELYMLFEVDGKTAFVIKIMELEKVGTL